MNNIDDIEFTKIDSGVKTKCYPMVNSLTLIGSRFIIRPIEYYSSCSVADSQTMDSCVANATCAVIEYWINGATGLKVQLDADYLYAYALDTFHKNDQPQTAGLYIDEAFKAAKQLNWIPTDSIVESITLCRDELVMALLQGPLVVANWLSNGWKPMNLNKAGAINESFPIFAKGHATALVGWNIKNECEHMILQNSWGSYGPMKGLVGVSATFGMATMLAYPILFVPAKGTLRKYNGWEKGVIK